MSRRRGWKNGDWLVKDEESGFVEYASNMERDYYGVLKKKSQQDDRHPQDFIIAKRDPYAISPTNPPDRNYDQSESVQGFFVGNTIVPAPTGPATHLYRPGIGTAEVGYDFFVY